MSLDLINPETWISHLLEKLPEAKCVSPLRDDNPEWEYIDGEIVKLGSLGHSQLDIPEIQRRGLILLSSESKDFRLVAHLLRTLQHSGAPLLALRLLGLYVEHFWTIAAPQNMAHKKRFAGQIMKRFEVGVSGFTESAEPAQHDTLLGELTKLTQCWKLHNAPELAQLTDDLLALYQREFRSVAPPPSDSAGAVVPQTIENTLREKLPGTAKANSPNPTLASLVVFDSSDEAVWRDMLLKMADILCARQPDSPQGYRLRRYALWQTITATPQAESDGRTPLAAVPVDRVADYKARLASPDMAFWVQVEKSVLLAPYWMDGHYLSAQTALLLGYPAVAEAILDEVICFLERLPLLSGLLFNDRTPFVSDQTRNWLASASVKVSTPVVEPNEELQAARACFTEHGLETALRYLDALPEGTPREQFYRQYSGAQLMEEAGMVKIAQQQYRALFNTGSRMMLTDWEPSLLVQLEHKFMAEQ